MKKNQEFINKPLGKQVITMVWDHFSPEEIWVIKGDHSENINKSRDLNIRIYEYKNTLGTIWWNDKDAYLIDVEGGNLEDAKRKDLNNIKKQMKANNNEDYIYLSGNIYGSENEWFDDDVKNYKAEDYLNDFIGFIEGSYVDKDSSYALALVDLNNEDILLSGRGNVNFITFEDFQDMF